MDVVCVEYGTLRPALETLRSCAGPSVRRRLLVRCGPRQQEVQPPGIEVLPLVANPGFGTACNRGADRGQGEWILFLNPDCRPRVADLERLLALAREVPGLAALGPGLYREGGRVDRSHGVDLASPWRLLDRPRPPRGLREVDWVAGTCLLVRREAFEEVGGFDEAFFLYCEDADLCLRLRRRGWRVMVTGAVSVPHVGGASFPDPDSRRRAYLDGRRTYMQKNAGILMRWLWQAGCLWKEATA